MPLLFFMSTVEKVFFDRWSGIKDLFTSPFDLMLAGGVSWGTYRYAKLFFESFSASEASASHKTKKIFTHRVTQVKDGAFMCSYFSWGVDLLSKKNIIPIGEMGSIGMHAFALVRYGFECIEEIEKCKNAIPLFQEEGEELRKFHMKQFILSSLNFPIYFSLSNYSLLTLASKCSLIAINSLFIDFFLFLGFITICASVACSIFFDKQKDAELMLFDFT